MSGLGCRRDGRAPLLRGLLLGANVTNKAMDKKQVAKCQERLDREMPGTERKVFDIALGWRLCGILVRF